MRCVNNFFIGLRARFLSPLYGNVDDEFVQLRECVLAPFNKWLVLKQEDSSFLLALKLLLMMLMT